MIRLISKFTSMAETSQSEGIVAVICLYIPPLKRLIKRPYGLYPLTIRLLSSFAMEQSKWSLKAIGNGLRPAVPRSLEPPMRLTFLHAALMLCRQELSLISSTL